jgi:hypothetical protein
MAHLRTPYAQEDGREVRQLALQSGGQRFLVVVQVVAHRADDFLGLGDDRQVLDLRQLGGDGPALHVGRGFAPAAAGDVVAQRGDAFAPGREIDHAVADDGTEGLAAGMAVGEQFHGWGSLWTVGQRPGGAVLMWPSVRMKNCFVHKKLP